jgi:hypothetical protein
MHPDRPIRYCGDAWDRELVVPVFARNFPRDPVTGQPRQDLQEFKWPDGATHVVQLYTVEYDSQELRRYLGLEPTDAG